MKWFWLTLIALVLLIDLGHAQGPVQQTVANLGTQNIFTASNQFLLGAQFGPVTFNRLPPATSGTTIYCSDCQQTNPCVGGGTGAVADAINGIWTCSAGAGGNTGNIVNANQYSLAYYSLSGSNNTIGGIPIPTGLDGVPQSATFSTTGGNANIPAIGPSGIVPRASTCPSNADTILLTDRAKYVSWNDASACTVTLPQSNSTGFGSNFVFVGCNIGVGTATISPTTSTISYSTGSAYTSGATTLPLTTGQCAWVYSDNVNYIAIVRGGGGGVTGSGTTGTYTIWTSSSAIGNSNLTDVVGPPAGINYSLGGGQSWQIDASHISFNSGIAGSGNIILANTFAPGSNNNAGGIELLGAPATGSACAGGALLFGGQTNGAGNGSTIQAGGGCSNGFGATGASILIQGGNTAASNNGGNIVLQPGTGGSGAGQLQSVQNGATTLVQTKLVTQGDIVLGSDYTNSTVTPSTVFSATLPATTVRANYKYHCKFTWRSTNTTLVGPVIGLNISTNAPTQLTGTGYISSSLTTVSEALGYLSNTTTGSQTLVTGPAAAVTNTDYKGEVYGTIEGAATTGSTLIINAAATSGTTATLNIRRGSSCIFVVQ